MPEAVCVGWVAAVWEEPEEGWEVRACTSGQAGRWAVGGVLTGLDILSSMQPLLKKRGVSATTRSPFAEALGRVGGQGGSDRASCAAGACGAGG